MAANAQPEQAELDIAWEQRGRAMEGGFALPERVEAVIAGYRILHQERPADALVRWKLLRALHFAVDFTGLDETTKAVYVREAVELCDSGRRLLDDPMVDAAARARLSFWQAIARGMQAQRIGLFALVREGTATQMVENAQRALELDPSVDGGGPLRLLSRLHATLPRVPFVTSWVDRTEALRLAQRAYEQAPVHPGNQLVLALALLEFAPDRAEQARGLLRGVVDAPAREGFEAEDAAIRREAAARLDALET